MDETSFYALMTELCETASSKMTAMYNVHQSRKLVNVDNILLS